MGLSVLKEFGLGFWAWDFGLRNNRDLRVDIWHMGITGFWD